MAQQTFQPHDLLRYQSITGIHVLGSTRNAVVAVQSSDASSDGYSSALWLVPLDGDPPRQFTAGVSTDMGPQWTPDGSRLAFVSSREDGLPQVHLIDADGGEARRLTRLKQGVVAAFWSPDGSRLLMTAPVAVSSTARGRRDGREPAPNEPHVIWRMPYKADGLGFTLNREIHLFVANVDDGTATQLTNGPFDVRCASWSPDGTRIAFTRTRAGREAHRTDVWVMDADGAHCRQLTDRVASSQYPYWSPDGNWIVFSGGEEEGDSQLRLWRIDMRDGTLAPLGGEEIEVESGDTVHWSADGSRIVYVQVRRGLQEIAAITVPEGTVDVLVSGQRHILKLSAGDRLLYVAASVTEPAEVYSCAWDGSDERQHTDLNAWWRERELPRVSLRQFDVPDGKDGTEPIDGWLLLPPGNAGGPFPLLLDVHGGPQSVAFVEFQKHVYRHVLCSRGWAILALNPVGSSSYGPEFARRLRGKWGRLDLDQQLAAMQRLRDEGLADDRVAITGKSYGGYLSAWAISQTQLFKAAVVSAPVSNLESHFGTSDTGYYVTPYSLRGEPFINRDVSRDLSPMQRMEQATTPTLILQGTEDARCPVGQSEEMFATLMRSGDSPVEMILYPGGDHHLAENGRPSHRVDYVTRLVEWLERWVNEANDDRSTNEAQHTASSAG